MSIKSSILSVVVVGMVAAAGWAVATGQVVIPTLENQKAHGSLDVVAAPPAAPVTPVDTSDRKTIETIIREYLINNPEILREMANALQAKEQTAQKERVKEAFGGLKPKIFSSDLQMVMGNPQGDVTLVEFFDYNCGFCRRALSDLNTLMEQDPNLRVVMKEFPVLSDESIQAARVAIAVHRKAPEKYAELHRALLAYEGQVNGEAALKIAEGMGLKADELMADANSPETEAYIRESHELAQNLGISGTPSYVVGEDVLAGAVGLPALQEAVKNVRACGRASCS